MQDYFQDRYRASYCNSYFEIVEWQINQRFYLFVSSIPGDYFCYNSLPCYAKRKFQLWTILLSFLVHDVIKHLAYIWSFANESNIVTTLLITSILARIYHLHPRRSFAYLVKKFLLLYVTRPSTAAVTMCRTYRSFLQMAHVFLSFSPVFEFFSPWLESSRSRVDFVPESGSGTVVLNSLSVGIRWIIVNALVFGRELRIYSFVFLKLRGVLYASLQCYSV